MSEKSVQKFQSIIPFSNVWEDAEVVCDALRLKAKNGRLLSAGATGDQVFALLTLDPYEIVAVERESSQLACLELRMAAYRDLNYASMLAFLGITPSTNRNVIYAQLRRDLTDATAYFWDQHPKAIEEGIIHSGRMEKKMRFFAQSVLPWIHRRSTLSELLQLDDPQNQISFYEKRWDSFFWRAAIKMIFGKEIDLQRLREVMTRTPIASNPYLHYFLQGNFDVNVLPISLKEDNFDIIREKIPSLRLANVPIEIADKGNFDGFNLLTYFDEIDRKETQQCYQTLLNRANPGAQVFWWSRHKFNGTIKPLEGKSIALQSLSKQLFRKDKGWFTQHLEVHEVL